MRDLRFAIRQWLKAPGFTLVAVLTLSLGIGVCTLVFSWVRVVLVDIVPGARDPDRLVVLVLRNTNGELGDTLSRLDEIDLGAETNLFAGVIGSQMEATALRIGDEVEWVWAQPVTANYFDVLGVRPILGPGFRAGDDQGPHGNPVAVISHRLWQHRFRGDPAVIGRTVEISRHPFTIVGVAPETFRGTMGGLGFDLWMPVTMSTEYPDMERALQSRGWRWLHTMARLRAGVSVEQAQAGVDVLMRRAQATYPDSNRNVGVAVLPVWKAPYGAQSRLLPLLTALTAVAALLHLLVIANVANLLLARSTSRENEMAVRQAIGAGTGRLIRQTLIESLLLAGLGGLLGFALATVFGRALLWMIPATYLPLALQFPIDTHVFGFMALTAIGTGLLFGLVPAWRAAHANVAEVLKSGGRTGDASRQSQRIRQSLVVAEIAAAFVLLTGMMLCARSFEKARLVSVGLDPKGVWVAGFRLPPGAYTPAEAALFYQRLKTELARLPGVESVALADWLPLGFEGGSSTRFDVPGYQPAMGENVAAGVCLVSEGYFSTLRIPVVRGREFDARDRQGAPLTVVINDEVATRYFPGRDPLGQTIRLWEANRTVVGVSKTGRYRSLNEAPRPYLYVPFEQIGDHSMTAVIRTRGAPESIGPAVERTAAAIDPNGKPVAAMAMTLFMEAAYLIPRTAAILLGVLGAVAVLLAALGIYAVIAWSAGRRVREVGIRMALGARRQEVSWLFLSHGLKLTLAALVLGVLGALCAGRVLASLLVDISAADPLTYLLALTGLFVVVGLACWIPARKASRTDPMTALRTE